jgi:predicted amidohydrolase YtcJ
MNRSCRALVASVFGLLVITSAFGSDRKSSSSQTADIIITNAKIYTVDSKQPWAEAVAIRGSRIVFVGSARSAAELKGAQTKVIDAGGKLVLPGIEDSHVHFVGGSRNLDRVDLMGAKTVSEMQRRIREFSNSHKSAAWIQGRGWMYATFPGNMPNKKMLDEVVPDRPALMSCADGHTTWVNSKALALAKIDRNTPNPANGIIVRDENGEPTGALQEAASSLVRKVIPEETKAEMLDALRRGLKEASRVGVTRVHSLGGDFEHLDLLETVRREGNLTTRFSVAYFVDPPGLTDKDWKALTAARNRYRDEWISEGGVKMMLDGVIDSFTGAMLEPYVGKGEEKGKLFWDPDIFMKTVAELDSKEVQVSTHAIGDAAIRLALDAYENAAKVNGPRDRRDKVEHIENVAQADIGRFAQLGVIASFQPLHANPEPNWMGSWIANVGPERERRAFAWKAVSSTNGRLAFGSDWPVVTINPWQGMQVAVTRQDFEGKPPEGWQPQLRVTMKEAIEAYTMGGAYSMFRENDEGSIETGKLADLIMVSQNVFEIDPHKIGETKVLTTMVGGKIVYEAQ